jgi:hypothetical protein
MIPKLNMQGPREASNSVGRTVHNSLSTKSQDQISVLGEKTKHKISISGDNLTSFRASAAALTSSSAKTLSCSSTW